MDKILEKMVVQNTHIIFFKYTCNISISKA